MSTTAGIPYEKPRVSAPAIRLRLIASIRQRYAVYQRIFTAQLPEALQEKANSTPP
jgi:hypothetical protein